MQCSDVQFQINALIDGELNAWSATRVRRHLKTCRDCRADYDANQRLTGQARAWRTVNAPHILGERLTDAIIHASITAENRPMPSITGTPAAPRRLAIWKPLTALGAGAAAFATIALLIPGSPTRPLPAFADVERTIQQARTITCTSTLITFDRQTGQPNGRRTNKIWLRRTPPASASVPVPGKALPSGNVEEKMLQDERGVTTYWVPGTSGRMNPPYKIDTLNAMTPQKIQRLLRAVLSPGSVPGKGDRSWLHITSVKSETGSLAGKPVLKFVRRYWFRNQPENTECAQTAYAVPGTLQLIQVETKSYTQKTRRLYSTELDTDFRYNVSPAMGTFDWSPPKGASVCIISRTPAGRYLKSKIIPFWPGGSYRK